MAEGSLMSMAAAAKLIDHVASLLISDSNTITVSRAGHSRRRYRTSLFTPLLTASYFQGVLCVCVNNCVTFVVPDGCRSTIERENAECAFEAILSPDLAAYAARLARNTLETCSSGQQLTALRGVNTLACSAMRLHEASCQARYQGASILHAHCLRRY